MKGRDRRDRRLRLQVILGVLLLGLALAGAAYPLWWDHRSSVGGNALLQRARRSTTAVQRHGTPVGVCPGTQAGRLARATVRRPGVLSIPAIGLTAPVLEGLSDAVLNVSVGHDPVTVWPGAHGESVLLAHDVSYFSGLDRVRPGDRVIWRLGCYQAVFRVLHARVAAPGALLYAPPSGYGLALITCWPTDALFWTPERFIVEATRVGTRSAIPPATVPRGSVTRLEVPAPPALASRGLALGQLGVIAGRLTIFGSPSESFRQGRGPLAAADTALEEYAAAHTTAVEQNQAWWSAIALGGVPMPRTWSLAFRADVRLVVTGTTVETAIVSSPAMTMTLKARRGALYVATTKPEAASQARR